MGIIGGSLCIIHARTRQPYAGWDGLNSTGWWAGPYDDACETAVTAWPDVQEYEQAHLQAQTIFAQNLPMIPLFPRLKFVAANPGVVGFEIDTTQESELWNLYLLDLALPD